MAEIVDVVMQPVVDSALAEALDVDRRARLREDARHRADRAEQRALDVAR
jgi:hypothetical protein